MSVESKKVCPNCGNNTFNAVETVVNDIVITGEGRKLCTMGQIDSSMDTNVIQCVACKVSIDKVANSLVTEAYFHEHIALKEMGSL